ncbi:MAG: hypothetical protein RL120_13805, partial [Gammaproteobacteria bacterium]
KYTESDPERTLITLDQLSQTIEVMTTVVNRLRQHLSEQLKAQIKEQEKTAAKAAQEETSPVESRAQEKPAPETKTNRESFVVEINNSQEPEPSRKNDKVLH